ncbi:homoserine kinase [Thermovirga lienii]|uniref:homoserine kinase n=1 Tax=Thermovirga lienii TaxID=336261 RepID=UPI000ECF859B|nr:homoserine kinase [Thermovirga sp.]MDN5367879.1 homoserine kinase [Thermovirga sp.]HCD72297.1 homoserine kinase [Thermovirga lienii]
MMEPIFRVKVPATSANLGSGFDTMGLALSLYNFYDVLALDEPGAYKVEVYGEGAAELEKADVNLIIKSYEQACSEWGMESPGLTIRCLNAIPLYRGLGSSASAIAGGVMIANALREDPLSVEELLPLMVRMEGHPDNIVPCCLGGMVVSCMNGTQLRYVRLPSPPKEISAVVAVPEVHVSTKDARQALPAQISHEDAVFSLNRAALLAASWAVGKWENLTWAMDDRLHQPFRAKLFPGGEEILEEVKKVRGCLGVAISGSGPSMLALTHGSPREVAEAMCRLFTKNNLRSRFFVLSVDEDGATIEKVAEEEEVVA